MAEPVSPYHPESLGAAERGVKTIIKRTKKEKTSFEEAFAAFKDTRNSSGFLPNQLFFLRNVMDPKLPSLTEEPVTEEMVQTRVRQRVERAQEGRTKLGCPA